jgi:hypothetical protein
MTTKNQEVSARVPIQNALCRLCASFLTWPIEKSKLIFQAEGLPVVSHLIAISLRNHLHGALGQYVIVLEF